MADIEEQKQSESVRIVGRDEEYAADVILKPDGSQRLLVDSETSISTELEILQEYDQDYVLSDTTYYDIYSGIGIITISGFLLSFNNKKVWVRLEIDGIEIFDINVEKFKDVSDWNSASQPQTYVSWNDALKVFYFTPNFPMKSSSSLKIQARSETGESKKYLGSIIQVG